MNVHRFVVGADHPDVGDATIRVDAHRRRFGPYSAAGSVVRAIVPTIDDVALVQRHDVEILTVAPTLAAGVTNERATLTSAARAEERTRFYPRARTRRVAHGLIDLLNEVVSRDGGTWTLVVDKSVPPADMQALEASLRAEMQAGDASLRSEFHDLRVEMHACFARAYILVAGAIGGSLVGGMGLAAAIG